MTPNITEWPKLELNKAIAELAYPNANIKDHTNGTVIFYFEGRNTYVEVDYCDNWNDLMPLVVEHRISLEHHFSDKDWSAYKPGWKSKYIHSDNKNPQRALCECVYLVLLAKSKNK